MKDKSPPNAVIAKAPATADLAPALVFGMALQHSYDRLKAVSGDQT